MASESSSDSPPRSAANGRRSQSPASSAEVGSSSMAVLPTNGNHRTTPHAASDVKLPPISTLGSFDDSPRPPNTMAPRPPFASAAMWSNGSSPRSGQTHLPPLPKFTDARSRAEQQQQQQSTQLSHNGGTHHSETGSAEMSPSAPSSSRLPPIEDASSSRLGDLRDHSRRNSAEHSSPSARQAFAHPFFDRGRETKGADASIERDASGRPQTDQLSQVGDALRVAYAIVQDGLNGHRLSDASLASATEAAGRAWTLLRETSLKSLNGHTTLPDNGGASAASSLPGAYSSSSSHGGPARPGAQTGFFGPARDDPVESAKARGSVPSRSIFGLNNKTSFTAAPAAPDRSPSLVRPAYAGQEVAVSHLHVPHAEPARGPDPLPSIDSATVSPVIAPTPQSNDAIPRPPTTVVRTHRYEAEQRPTPANGNSAEDDVSLAWAPSSLQKRFAARHGSEAEPPHSASYRPERPDGHLSGPDAQYREHPKGYYSMPPPPSTVHHPSAPAYHIENGSYAPDRRPPLNEAATKYKKRSRAPAPSSCKGCGTNETPEWRRGPDGARTLCNACGLHFAKLSKKKTTSPEDTMDPGYHGMANGGIVGPIDPSRKSVYG